MGSLNSQTAIVVGGSRGIGAAIVERLVHEGATVSFSFYQSTDAANALSARTGASAIQANSADRDALIKTIAAYGALNIAVVNAGYGLSLIHI